MFYKFCVKIGMKCLFLIHERIFCVKYDGLEGAFDGDNRLINNDNLFLSDVSVFLAGETKMVL